jgi:hypothetical protein
VLLDNFEETSQVVEKDPLDPLNDDFFPEKMYDLMVIIGNVSIVLPCR